MHFFAGLLVFQSGYAGKLLVSILKRHIEIGPDQHFLIDNIYVFYGHFHVFLLNAVLLFLSIPFPSSFGRAIEKSRLFLFAATAPLYNLKDRAPVDSITRMISPIMLHGLCFLNGVHRVFPDLNAGMSCPGFYAVDGISPPNHPVLRHAGTRLSLGERRPGAEG